jgi:hypothetical protein
MEFANPTRNNQFPLPTGKRHVDPDRRTPLPLTLASCGASYEQRRAVTRTLSLSTPDHAIFSRRSLLRTALFSAGALFLGEQLVTQPWRDEPLPLMTFDDEFVIVDGWVLRADEVAAVFS